MAPGGHGLGMARSCVVKLQVSASHLCSRRFLSMFHGSHLCCHHPFPPSRGVTVSDIRRRRQPWSLTASKGPKRDEPRRSGSQRSLADSSFQDGIDGLFSVKDFTSGQAGPKPGEGEQVAYLHVAPGDEALAPSVAGLEELLCLPQHGQLCWGQLLGLLPWQVIQGAWRKPTPPGPPAGSLGSVEHSPVGGGHADLSVASSRYTT